MSGQPPYVPPPDEGYPNPGKNTGKGNKRPGPSQPTPSSGKGHPHKPDGSEPDEGHKPRGDHGQS